MQSLKVIKLYMNYGIIAVVMDIIFSIMGKIFEHCVLSIIVQGLAMLS